MPRVSGIVERLSYQRPWVRGQEFLRRKKRIPELDVEPGPIMNALNLVMEVLARGDLSSRVCRLSMLTL